MSPIEEIPFFTNLLMKPFTVDQMDGLKAIREERSALPLQLKATIDPDIDIPEMEEHSKMTTEEIEAYRVYSF